MFVHTFRADLTISCLELPSDRACWGRSWCSLHHSGLLYVVPGQHVANYNDSEYLQAIFRLVDRLNYVIRHYAFLCNSTAHSAFGIRKIRPYTSWMIAIWVLESFSCRRLNSCVGCVDFQRNPRIISMELSLDFSLLFLWFCWLEGSQASQPPLGHCLEIEYVFNTLFACAFGLYLIGPQVSWLRLHIRPTSLLVALFVILFGAAWLICFRARFSAVLVHGCDHMFHDVGSWLAWVSILYYWLVT